MKSFLRLLAYMKNYKVNVFLNIVCNLFMALFTAVSIPAIIPFLQILFDEAPKVTQKPVVTNVGSAIEYAQYLFSNSLQENGQSKTLVYICIVIVVLYFFINLFRYLSLFFNATGFKWNCKRCPKRFVFESYGIASVLLF